MLGWEMAPDQLGDGRPGLNSLVKNLYFTGHWTQPGCGITPVIVSAMQVAKMITQGNAPFTRHETELSPTLPVAPVTKFIGSIPFSNEIRPLGSKS